MKSNRMKFCLLVTVLVILGQAVAFAAAAAPPGGGGGETWYTVYGYVKRSGTSQSLWSVSVKVYKDGVQYVGSTVTSTSGYFSVRFYGWCDFVKIEVSCWGYYDTYKIVNIRRSQTSTYAGYVYMSPTPKKGYALVVGISDYQYGGDLQYCDEDATDWYNELNDREYDIRVLGDTHSANYPMWHGKATKSNLRHYVRMMARNAGPGDTLVFTFAGHGGPVDIYNNDQGYMATWENYAQYHDHEFYDDFLGTQASRVFIFLDTCRAGSFIDEFQEDTSGLKQKVFITTAVPWDGLAFSMYGIDEDWVHNGAWSHFFITECDDHESWSMETCFTEAFSSFQYWYENGPYGGKHRYWSNIVEYVRAWVYDDWDWPPGSGTGVGVGAPQCFDGNTGSAFYL